MVLVKFEQLIENQQYKPNDIDRSGYKNNPILYIMILLSTKVIHNQMNIYFDYRLINIYYQ